MPQLIKLPPFKVNTRAINIECPHCRCTLAYEEDEVERVDNESMGIYCPYCKGAVETKHIKPFTFPDTFYKMCGKSEPCCSDKEIQKMVDQVKQELVDYPEDEFNYMMSGNVVVFGYVEKDGENVYHHIIVAKEYWEDEIKVDVGE